MSSLKRDPFRCREDIRMDLMRARYRIGKFQLRRELWEGNRELGRANTARG